MNTEVSFIIVNYKTKDLTTQAIASIVKHAKGFSYEIILIDNNSQDTTVEFVKKKLP